MEERTVAHRLSDIVEASDRIRTILLDLSLEAFKEDWEKRWLVERGVEIISEASRYLSEDFKGRHAEIPWPKVASIGNILRHAYDRVAPDVLWKLSHHDLPILSEACRQECARLED